MIAQESKIYLNPANRTITTSFILPFIFEKKDILFNKYGFVNAFLEDINKPWLDNHIFILYETCSISSSIEDNMKKNPYYYDTKQIVIDNKYYDEYIFVIPPEIKTIVDAFKQFSYNVLTAENKIKILKFWNCFDFEHVYKLLHDDNEFHALEGIETIPEEDPIDEFNQINSEIFFHKLGLD
jgi:hypothetical protein